MSKEYILKLKRGKLFTFLKKVFTAFKKKPEIHNLSGGELKSKAIYISNHAGAGGPLSYELFFPKRITPWGAHEMCGNYKSRWNYLYHVFYRQKLHWGKVRSFIVATLFAIISINLYNAVGLIGTYQDGRSIKSIKQSHMVLDEDSAILIFPEDSTSGYIEPPKSFNKGYLLLAKTYYKLRKVDLPIYNMYFDKKLNKLFIDKPLYYNALKTNGMCDEEINQLFVNKTGNLYGYANGIS